ncbi:unnamed protein product [Orchesella dallaii]|uniref:Gustatory receptor n=1 Tax=Orchesella dallaii TaxID=48710 RepID=A0ABP1R2V0_9HEXA
MNLKRDNQRKVNTPTSHFLTFPIRVSQICGAFPFSFDETNMSLSFSWKSFAILMMVTRYICSLLPPLLSPIITDLHTIFARVGVTERLSQIGVNTTSGIADIICLVIMLKKRKRIISFFSSFTTKVIHLIKLGIGELTEAEVLEFARRKMKLNICIGIVLFLGIASHVNTVIFYYQQASQSGKAWWKVFIVGTVSVYWIALDQFRLLTFYFCIGIIASFRAAFTALLILVREKKLRQSRRLWWIIQMYKEIEVLLEEFQKLFGVQLLNICFTFLLPMINAGFLISKILTTSHGTNFDIHGLVTMIPHVISATITFSILCDSCSGMTDAAIKCVSSFRNVSAILEFNDDMQDKILMFYAQALANPPRISPGKFMHLGRQAIPSVCQNLKLSISV